jgi:RHS repeat-associated protein
MFRSILDRMAKQPLLMLLLLFALPAYAYDVNVAPAFTFKDGQGHSTMEDSQEKVLENVQAYFDYVGSLYDRTYTISNLHPEPSLPNYYTRNGVWYKTYFDLTACGVNGCNFHPNYGSIRSWPVCLSGYGLSEHVDSPTARTVICKKQIPEAQPPKCVDSCTGNPIYPSTGQKLQVETDYSGLPGLTFDRTYRSNLGHFASVTTSTFTDYSLPYGNTMWNCLPSYFIISGTPDRVIPHCFLYLTVEQPNYQLFTPDGRHLRFSGPSSSVTQSADVNERVTQVNGSGGIEWHVKREDDSTEIYDAAGALKQTILRNGQVFSYTYSDVTTPVSIAPRPGLLLTKTNAFGHTLSWKYDSSSRMVEMQDPAGGIYQYGYDTFGNMTQVTYPDGSTRSYAYNESANTAGANLPQALTGITDENGIRFATYKFDSRGRGTSTEHAGGVNKYTLSYANTSPGATATVVDPLGTSRSFQFQALLTHMKDKSSSQPSASGSGNVSRTYTYDVNGNLTSKVEYGGTRTCYTYDLTRNLESVRLEGLAPGQSCPANLANYTPTAGTAQRKTLTAWHGSFRLPTSISRADRTTAFTYDSNGNQLTRTESDTVTGVSRTWTYTYDGYGRVLTEDGPRTDVSDITTYAWYSCTTGYQCGQLHTITNPLGHVTTYDSYNAHGQPIQITDTNGLVTSLAYDLRQRITDRCVGGTLPGCAGGELTHMDYWPTGLLKKVTNPDGSFIEYFYDAAHRLTEIRDGALNRVVYTLDAMGNRTAENTYDPSNALRRTHSRIYNTLNRLWKDVNAAGTAAVTTTFGYDNNGNQTSTAAPLGRSNSSLYDELNRLKQITDPASGITQFGYDANDNLTSVTDPRSLTTSYSYNGLGDLLTQTSPDTGVTTNTYDSGGNLDTSTDSRGVVTDYEYDAANRVISTSFTLGGVTDQTITYGYDAGTNQNGLLTSASDAEHDLAWIYDTQGRVTGKGQTVGGTTLALGYGYNAAGQLGNVTLPSGNVISFGYDTNGQVFSLTLNGATTILSSISYDPFGPITGWTWGNGTAASRGFDADGKVTQVDNANGASLKNYAYDDAFRITGISDALDPSLSWSYGYDALDRLTSANSASLTQGWTYDANGNRLSETGSSPSTYTNSPTSNRVSAVAGSLARSYAYDNAGNTLAFGGGTFTYNHRGRMASASNGGVTATYTYNALGQRIRRVAAGVTTLYVYDEAGHPAGEYTGAGDLIQETVWLGDTPVATLRPDGSGGVVLYYVHADHLNTPRLVTDTANNIRWRWDSDPFGTTAPDENPSSLGAFVYSLRFPGQQYDAVVGLHYNYFRDYDPAVGRYVQSDPIGLEGGLNTYRYADVNPIVAFDFFGLRCVYSQSAGSLICTDNITGQIYLNCTGYSGRGGGINDPLAQIIESYGPIPRGTYIIGEDTRRRGPLTFPLYPAPFNNMFGRTAFLIHGDNSRNDRTASEGCIIANRRCREGIRPGEVLRVTQ